MRIYVRYNTNKRSGVNSMENPIIVNHTSSLVSKAKDTFYNHNGFEIFDVKPQMPKVQISHFAKKVIHESRPIAIQINEGNNIVSEIIGYPSFSENSGHLIIKNLNNGIIHLITGSTIRHIRKI